MPLQQFFLIFSLSLLFLLSSCTWGAKESTETDTSESSSSTIEEESLTPEQAEEKAKEIAQENRATFAEALESADPDLCEDIESIDLQFSCKQNAIFQLAVQKNDKTICSQLETEKGKEKCELNFSE